jgi:hypothetical protein
MAAFIQAHFGSILLVAALVLFVWCCVDAYLDAVRRPAPSNVVPFQSKPRRDVLAQRPAASGVPHVQVDLSRLGRRKETVN